MFDSAIFNATTAPRKSSVIPMYMLNKLRFGTALIAVQLFHVKQSCYHMLVLTLSDSERTILLKQNNSFTLGVF